MLTYTEATSYIARVLKREGEAAARETAARMADGAKAWFAASLYADAVKKAE